MFGSKSRWGFKYLGSLVSVSVWLSSKSGSHSSNVVINSVLSFSDSVVFIRVSVGS